MIITHHAPTFRKTSAPRHQQAELNVAFCSNLEYLMGDPILVWIHGHTVRESLNFFFWEN